jgi:glycosyltransferase involved in cell wall biosynthesis
MAEYGSDIGRASQSLSIVVPVYKIINRSENLVKWISDPQIKFAEIILVHDLSDNEDCDFLRKYSSVLENVTLIEEFCGSPGTSRNLGLNAASRPWIVFWDCDDFPNIRELLSLLNNTIESGADVGIGSFDVRQRKSGKILNEFKNEITYNLRYIHKLFPTPGLWRWVFKRSLIGELRFDKLQIGEDALFLIELEAFDMNLFISSEIVYSYYVGDENQQTSKISNAMRIAAIEAIDIARKHRKHNSKKFGMVISNRLKLGSATSRNLKESLFRFPMIVKSTISLAIFSRGNYRKFRAVSRRYSFQKHAKRELKTSIYMAGGLGNQLFQLSYGLHISKSANLELIGASKELHQIINTYNNTISNSESNSRILLREEKNYLEKKLRNFLLSRKREARRNSLEQIFQRQVSFLVRNILSKIAQVQEVYVASETGFGGDEVIFPNGDVACIGYFQSFKYTGAFETKIAELLLNAIQENSKLNDLISEANKKHIVAVQIRLGDYKLKSNMHFGVITCEYLRKSLSLINNTVDFDEIWVFSDDIQAAKEIFPDVNQPIRWMADKSFGSLENLLLLSQASSFIISNSTFGWWGAALSMKPNKFVICPSPWFKQLSEPKCLVPDSWHRITNPF